MAVLRIQLLALASGQTDLNAVVSSVEAAARTSLASAETILGELDDAYKANTIDFEAFSVLKKSVVTTIIGMESSEQKLDFDLTLEPGDLDERTVFNESIISVTNVPDTAGTTESIDVGPGTLLRGRFYVDEELGKGGMGTVYKGRDVLKLEAQDRNPYIAIKVLNEDVKQRSDAFIALQREASRQQRLAHPNIATVYDFDRVGGVIFITMELLEGTPLDEYLDNVVVPRGGLSLEEALPIITSLGSALAFAHNSEIIHSDFKPSNCFLTANKGIKILDFGIARAVRKPGQQAQTLFDGSTLGAMTPSYASCEMLESLGDPHPGDDVYALACVTYELLTGKHPYNRLPANVAAENNLKPSPVPKLTRAQNRALARGVAFHRKDRTPSAEEFVQSLTGTTTAAPKMWRIAAIAGVATVFVVAGIFGVSQFRQGQLDDIVDGVVSVDPLVVEAALQRIAALDVDERQQILNRPAAKDGITGFFENNITAQATALDFPGVDETLARARSLYSDSARIEAAAQSAIEEKNRLLGELSETYESLLRSKKLLADPAAEDIPDVIERLKKIDPQHGLITDPRLASTYAKAADSLISEFDFNGASAIIDAGQLLAPSNAALINTQDRLNKERIVADRRARSQQLEQKLAPAVAGTNTLQSFKPLTTDLIALAKVGPDSAVIVAAREKFRVGMEDRLTALKSTVEITPLVALHDEYAPLLGALSLSELSDQISSQRDAAIARVEGLTNAIEDAIAWGNLDAPADNNATSQLATLTTIAPGDSRAVDLQEKLINAYASRANDKTLAGEWDDARSQIAKARQLQPSAALEGQLQQALDNIDIAEQQAQERLASAGKQRAAEEKQQRIADLEAQLVSATKGASTIDDSRQILRQLSRLESIAPGHELIKTTRSTLAAKLSAAAQDKGSQGGNWDAALKDINYVVALFPDSAAAVTARTQVESGRAEALTLAKQNEIGELQTQLTGLAGAKPDEAWSNSTTAVLAELAQKVPADDPWLVQMRAQLTSVYLTNAAKLQASQRFTLASQQLDRAEKINPKSAKINQARDGLKASVAEFRSAQREKDIAARIEAHKQTFVAHINSKKVTNAKKTLALLMKDLPADDPFIKTKAPNMLARVYLQFANSKIAQKDYGSAIGFAESGLKYRPADKKLAAALKSARAEQAQIRAVAVVPKTAPTPRARPVVTK